MKDIYVVVCNDRHCDPIITVHETREGADGALEDFMASYNGQYQFEETGYGKDDGWLRHVKADQDEGPDARIEGKDLLP